MPLGRTPHRKDALRRQICQCKNTEQSVGLDAKSMLERQRYGDLAELIGVYPCRMGFLGGRMA